MTKLFDDDEDLLKPGLTPAPRVPALVRELAAGAALAVAVAAGCDSGDGQEGDGGRDAPAIIAPMAPPPMPVGPVLPPMPVGPMLKPPMVAPVYDAAVPDTLPLDATTDQRPDGTVIAPMAPPPMPPPMPNPPRDAGADQGPIPPMPAPKPRP
jgi:hypothetical protein